MCIRDSSVFFPAYSSGDGALRSETGSRIEGIGRPRVEPSFVSQVIDRMLAVPDSSSVAAMRFFSELLDRRVGPSTGSSAGEGRIRTAGGFDAHIHFIAPQQLDEARMSGVTTMLGGGTGPARPRPRGAQELGQAPEPSARLGGGRCRSMLELWGDHGGIAIVVAALEALPLGAVLVVILDQEPTDLRLRLARRYAPHLRWEPRGRTVAPGNDGWLPHYARI